MRFQPYGMTFLMSSLGGSFLYCGQGCAGKGPRAGRRVKGTERDQARGHEMLEDKRHTQVAEGQEKWVQANRKGRRGHSAASSKNIIMDRFLTST